MIKFSEDYNYVYIKEGETVYGFPVSTLTDEEKREIYEQKAKEGYG